MSGPSHHERRLSFGAAASQYDRFRPTYAREAVRWLSEGATREVREVADVGAGTGALTRVLLECGYEVTSVEPDESMLDQLRAGAPRAVGVVGSAEALPLANASVDAITVGQAWHWFEPEAAAREFTRVVRPGGVIGLLWNDRDDREPWLASLRRIVQGEDWVSIAKTDALSTIGTFLPGVELRQFAHVVTMTPEAVIGLVGTFSFVRLRADADQISAAVGELLRTHRDTRDKKLLEVPYVTTLYRAPRP